MLHALLLDHLQQRLSDFFAVQVSIHHYQPVHGGDINKCYMLETSKGRFFIKVNASFFGLDMFEKEARGLVQLANAGVVKVPRPLFDGRFNQQIFLAMEYIEPGTRLPGFWEDFGASIAKLHATTGTSFGLDDKNYIGKMVQSNNPHQQWVDFYATERILPLASQAKEKGLLEDEHLKAVETLCSKLKDIFPEEKPALLHGDLWSGNFITAENGRAAIFDPAVYFGHREMDIAMSLLFGGFDAVFYESYNHYYPLYPGWEQRVPLCQLYPLLVHLLLFGGHYGQNVIEIVQQYR
ncbi:MAG TPA: fructosamine kinase family protein [Agriterribacter sp.]|nr:fructosamine kinase family protein [Agriterribacter sp.]